MRRLAVLLAVPLVALVSCGGDDDDDGGQAFCDRARSFDAEFAEIEEEFEGNEVPTGESFETAANAIEEFAEDAPDAIRDDVEAMAEAMHDVASMLDDLDVDLTANPEDLSEEQANELIEVGNAMGERLEGIEEPGQRIEAYLEEECGISPDE
jgi:hypothetical protein